MLANTIRTARDRAGRSLIGREAIRADGDKSGGANAAARQVSISGSIKVSRRANIARRAEDRRITLNKVVSAATDGLSRRIIAVPIDTAVDGRAGRSRSAGHIVHLSIGIQSTGGDVALGASRAETDTLSAV